MAWQDELTGQLTVGEAARVAGVSRQAVHAWIGRRRLTAIPTDDGDRIDADDLFRLLAVRRAAAVAGVGMDTLLRWTDGAGALTDAAEVAAGDGGAGGLVDEGDHTGGLGRLTHQPRHERHQALVVGGHSRHATEHPHVGPGPMLDAEAPRVRLAKFHGPAFPAHAPLLDRPHPIGLAPYAPRRQRNWPERIGPAVYADMISYPQRHERLIAKTS
jgi:hypothetical protein